MPNKFGLRKFHQFFEKNDKRRNYILLRILDQIEQDNEVVKDGINESATICNEEGLSFNAVFY